MFNEIQNELCEYKKKRKKEKNYSLRAFTTIRSRCIKAHRSFTAYVSISSTFINVNAHRTLWFKSILAETLSFNTFSICGTVEVTLTQNIHIDLFTSNFWIGFGSKALWAFTVVARICIFTNCTWRAWLFECQTFINVNAAFIGISRVIWFA